MVLGEVEPVRGTEDGALPFFSPDGLHIAYTITEARRAAWDTWIVPVSGGPARKLFSNTTGLTWIGPGRILFSQIETGMHMGVVTSSESQSDIRKIYFPAHERARGHENGWNYFMEIFCEQFGKGSRKQYRWDEAHPPGKK